MKREIVTAIVFFVGFWVCASHVVAQPEVRYPNPAYMYWEEPCPEISGLSVTGMPHYCFFYYPIRTQDGIAQN